MTALEERHQAALTPMWTRIERGEIDLAQYTDEEILTGKIRMADGRMLPQPPRLPDVFVREQNLRAARKAQRLVREGALASLDVYRAVLDNTREEAKDRLAAAKFFTDRFLGKPEQHVVTHDGNADAAREALIARLLAVRGGQPVEDDVVDGEIVEDLTLEDLL